MASLKKCHTQNAFTIEMSIMFYDIAAKGPRKTNQVKGKTRPAKYFHLPDKSWHATAIKSDGFGLAQGPPEG